MGNKVSTCLTEIPTRARRQPHQTLGQRCLVFDGKALSRKTLLVAQGFKWWRIPSPTDFLGGGSLKDLCWGSDCKIPEQKDEHLYIWSAQCYTWSSCDPREPGHISLATGKQTANRDYKVSRPVPREALAIESHNNPVSSAGSQGSNVNLGAAFHIKLQQWLRSVKSKHYLWTSTVTGGKITL